VENQTIWYETLQAVALALLLGAVLGDWVASNWRVKALLIGLSCGLAETLVPENNLGFAHAIPNHTIFLPVAAFVVSLLLCVPLLRPRPRIQMLSMNPMPLLPGQVITAQITFMNRGDEEAYVTVANYCWVEDTSSADQQQLVENDRFAKFILEAPDEIPRHAIPPGVGFSTINQGPVLSEGWCREFQEASKTFYFMGTVKYKDSRGVHYRDYCQYVTREGVFPCKRHNRERGY
jgi:hypothetical protein